MNNSRMRVTQNTTDSEIANPVILARQRLAEHARDAALDIDALAADLNRVAMAEGNARAQHVFREALVGMLNLDHSNPEAAVTYAKEAMTGLLLGSPDDTWSGRRNDVRRSYNDGVREAAAFLIRGY